MNTHCGMIRTSNRRVNHDEYNENKVITNMLTRS